MRAKKENPLRQLPVNSNDYGEIRIHLKEILEERNKLRNYIDNKIQRLDIDILKRLCYVLDCDLHELIEYIPKESTSKKS